MQEQITQLREMQTGIDGAMSSIGIEKLEQEIVSIEQKMAEPDFWSNPDNAKSLTQRMAKIKNTIDPWKSLKTQIDEALELSKTGDMALKDEIEEQIAISTKEYANLKNDLLYGGVYDDHDAIISIYSGAGGTDAQDWAQMLERMYIRWAESKKGIKVEVIEESSGDEAGIKSATLEVSGPLVYGKLKSEHGVHRLVRLSPFNADNLRQTSFAKVDVLPKIDQPDEVAIDDADLKIDVYRAGGHGGQSVNTTDSAVRVTHIPTGITVSIQNERSQLQNKEMALTILRSKLAQLKLEQHKERIEELKGPNEQAAWGNQIRNYVLHPYSMVKDVRTRYETSDVQAVLNGDIDSFMRAYLEMVVIAENRT